MEDVAVIGLDLAKSVFQVHGISERGEVVLRRRLSRAKLLSFFAQLPPCLLGMETCASANHWARELMALGHEVRLTPPQYVKLYVKRYPCNAGVIHRRRSSRRSHFTEADARRRVAGGESERVRDGPRRLIRTRNRSANNEGSPSRPSRSQSRGAKFVPRSLSYRVLSLAGHRTPPT